MSRTNIDFLFQVTAPLADRSLLAPGRNDSLLPGFGDHLSQASVSGTEPGTTSRRDNGKDYRPANTQSAAGGTAAGSSPSRTDSAPRGSASDNDTAHAAGNDDSPRSEEEQYGSSGTSAAGSGDASATANRPTNGADDDEKSSDDLAEVTEATGAEQAAAAALAAEAAAEVTEATTAVDEAASNAAADAQPKKLAAKARSGDKTTEKVGVRDAAKHVGQLNEHVYGQAAPDGTHEAAATTKAKRNSKSAEENDAGSVDGSQANGKIKAERGGATGNASEVVVAGDAVVAEEKDKSESAADVAKDGDQSTKASGDESNGRTVSKTTSRNEAVQVAGKIAAIALAGGAAANKSDGAANGKSNEEMSAVKANAPKGESLAAAANRLHGNSAASQRGGRADGAEDMPRIDASRFVGRVAKAFHTAQERGGTLQLRLSPPELGAMRIELTVKDGVMSAALETETATARKVLLDHLPALRDRLADQNIRVERFDVDVRRDGQGQTDDRAAQWQQQQQQQQQRESNQSAPQRQSTPPPRVGDAATTDSTLAHGINGTGINLFV